MTITREGGGLYMRFSIRGRRIHEPTNARTKAGALKVEAQRRLELLEQDDPRLRKAPILSDFAPLFLAHVDKRVEAGNLKPKTQASYRNGWRLLQLTKIINMRINQITTGHVQELTFPGGGSNANQALRTLRTILSYACEQKYLQAAPRIKLREENGRERTFAPWEEELFLKHAAPVLRDVLTIMFDCGMRPDEVCRMQWDDVKGIENSVLVQHGKSVKARRHVGLTMRMRDVLAGRKRHSEKKNVESPFVFASTRSKEGHVRWLSALWARTYARVESAAGKPLAPGLVPYSARHTYATNYLKAGGDIGQLSRLMGHTDVRTTMKYVHLLEASDAGKLMDSHNEAKLRILKRA